MTVIPQLPSLTLHTPFTLNCLTAVLLLLMHHAKRGQPLSERYCNSIDTKLVFSSFKMGRERSYPSGAPCRCGIQVQCYVGETIRHFSKRVPERMFRACHIVKQNFHASTNFQLNIKEVPAYLMAKTYPENHQLYRVNLKLSL